MGATGFLGRQGQPNDAMDFHLLQSFDTGRELRLAIGRRPIPGRTDRADNGTLRGPPGVVGDATNRFDLGFGERSAPTVEGRSPGVAANVIHASSILWTL
jgi:hypothetical protein